MYEFLIPIYYFEQSKTKKQQIDRMLRKSFKSYTGLKKTVETTLIQELMGYNISERSDLLQYISDMKWRHREKNELYVPQEDDNISNTLKTKSKNICKHLPKSMIKYINMQTYLCPACKAKGRSSRCSADHLEKNHSIFIEKPQKLIEQIEKLTISKKQHRRDDKEHKERRALLKEAEPIIRASTEKLQSLLNGTF